MKRWNVLLIGALFWPLMFGMNLYGAESEEYKLYLDITFKENLFFDKYDVDLYVDDKEIGTLEYASAFSKLVDVSGKKHTITFYKSSNHDYKGEEEIEIAQDSTYRATIQTDAKKINIVTSQIEENLEGSAIEVKNVSMMLLPNAIETLKEQGFNDITYKGYDGDTINKKSNWIVLSQNINPGEAIDKNEEINLSCQKIVEFLSEKFVDQTVPEAAKTANAVSYEISFIDSLTGRDMHNMFNETSAEKLDQWIVNEAVPVDSNQKVAILKTSYTGKTVVPVVEGMSLTSAIKELNIAQIGNVKGFSLQDKSIKESAGAEWKVITQNIQGGSEVNADEEIILKCIAYEELEDISLYDVEHLGTGKTKTEIETKEETTTSTEKETEIENKIETEPETELETEIETAVETEMETEEKEESSSEKERNLLLSLVDADDEEEQGNSIPGTSVYIVISKVNVRSKPSTAGDILGNYNTNDQVAVYKIENGWAMIDFNGIEAYVSANYIQKK